ncbi:hypothetical protein GCM10029964_026590 [Kibdelosporangium lantanae]
MELRSSSYGGTRAIVLIPATLLADDEQESTAVLDPVKAATAGRPASEFVDDVLPFRVALTTPGRGNDRVRRDPGRPTAGPDLAGRGDARGPAGTGRTRDRPPASGRAARRHHTRRRTHRHVRGRDRRWWVRWCAERDARWWGGRVVDRRVRGWGDRRVRWWVGRCAERDACGWGSRVVDRRVRRWGDRCFDRLAECEVGRWRWVRCWGGWWRARCQWAARSAPPP